MMDHEVSWGKSPPPLVHNQWWLKLLLAVLSLCLMATGYRSRSNGVAMECEVLSHAIGSRPGLIATAWDQFSAFSQLRSGTSPIPSIGSRPAATTSGFPKLLHGRR